METGPMRRLLLSAPAPALAALQPLVPVWARAGIAVEQVVASQEGPVDLPALLHQAQYSPDAVLVISPQRRSPANLVAGPLACNGAGGRMSVATLPWRGSGSLDRFVTAAMRAHQRAQDCAGANPEPAVALLGQWLPNYLRVIDRMETMLTASGIAAFRWSGDGVTRDAMVSALSGGLGLAIYVGHGRPVGWVGYHGVRAAHLDPEGAEPIGAVLSLCCRTASRRRVGLSFAEALALSGRAAASFGAISDTLHSDNTRWAVGLCDAVAGPSRCLHDLLMQALPQSPTAARAYRIFGDPFAPITSPPMAITHARSIATFA